MSEHHLKAGQTLTGNLFSEPMRVETVREGGTDTWVLGLVGVQSERFRNVTLTTEELAGLAIQEDTYGFTGDGNLLRLGLQAYSLGIAYESGCYPNSARPRRDSHFPGALLAGHLYF